jgi:hypothetical protein
MSSIIRVTIIIELGTTLAVTRNQSTKRSYTDIVVLHSLLRLLVIANVPSSPIIVTLMMEATCSSESSVITRVTRRNIPEDIFKQRISHNTQNLI